jgi:TRAP-type C4-dicarboxylate transport system permease small subunit
MQSLYRGLVLFCRITSVVLLAALVIILLAGIILREFFNTPLVWAIEVSLTIFVWIVFVGAGMAMADEAHIRLTLLVEKLPAPVRGGIELLVSYGGLVLLAALFWSSIEITWAFRNNSFTSIQVSTAWTWAAAPVGLGFMILAWLRTRPWTWRSSINTGRESGTGTNVLSKANPTRRI